MFRVEVKKTEIIIALIIAIPIILFPVAFVWYLNIGGTYALLKELAQKRHNNLVKNKARRETYTNTD